MPRPKPPAEKLLSVPEQLAYLREKRGVRITPSAYYQQRNNGTGPEAVVVLRRVYSTQSLLDAWIDGHITRYRQAEKKVAEARL